MYRSLFLVALATMACSKTNGDSGTDTEPPPSYVGIALRTDGWLRGDLHMHTEYDGGFETVETNIALGESLEDPIFLEAHPEFTGNGLDYLAITDHRTVEQQSDPGYHSDRLILVNGEEFGSSGHAGAHGVSTHVEHDPDGDGTTLEDLVSAIDHVHEQGGTFSPNHPMLPDIPWPWDTDGHDGIEVWNSGWGLMSPELTDEMLTDWETSHGPASPIYRRAVQTKGQNSSAQALTWYEAHVALGRHAAVIGGSDRHAILLPGFPTTWVRADTADAAGVVGGIQQRHTFISRTPASAQLLVEVTVDGETYEMGDEVPISASGTEVRITVRVGRATDGLLRLRAGSAATEADILTAPLGSVVLEEDVDSADFTVEHTMQVVPGDWVYPIVLEPLVVPGSDTDQALRIYTLAEEVRKTNGEDFIGLAEIFADLVDGEVLLDGSRCDPADWKPEMMQCNPVDSESLATFYVPDYLDRALNVVSENGQISDWCMGAVGSAIRFVE